jgi:hypothetical protein
MRVHKLREGEWIIVKNFRSAATEKEPKWRRWPEIPADAMGTYVISDHGRCFVGMVIGSNTTPPGLTDGLLWYGPVPDVPDELLPDQFKSMPIPVAARQLAAILAHFVVAIDNLELHRDNCIAVADCVFE